VPRNEELSCPVLPALHARVLGPARNPTVLRRLEIESSLALSTAERPEERGPFGRKWTLDPAHARRLFRRELQGWPLMEDLATQSGEELAFWLDKTVSNSSLVLLMRVGAANLLFPGDAQWDSWLPILSNEDLVAAMGRLSFLKASQHGSHNGTPLKLESVLGPVTSAVSAGVGPWRSMPHAGTLKALARHGAVVRSDRPGRGARRHWVDIELKTSSPP
jgi:hypothetical protein